MVYRSVRPQPPRGSTAWGAQQFSRVLDDEERIAAERERLRALGWRPPQPAAGAYADEPAFGDERDAYADMFQRQLDDRRALEDEARRRAGVRPHSAIAPNSPGDTIGSTPGWSGGGRFGVPVPDEIGVDPLLRDAGGSGRVTPGSAAALTATLAGLSLQLSRADMYMPTSREDWESHIRRVEAIEFAYRRTVTMLSNLLTPDELAALKEKYPSPFEALPQTRPEPPRDLDPEEGKEHSQPLPGYPDQSEDLRRYSQTPETIAPPQEPADLRPPQPSPLPELSPEPLVRLDLSQVLDRFWAAGILLRGESASTRQDNDDIIKMAQDTMASCGWKAKHSGGGSERETRLKNEDYPDTTKGDRLLDGSVKGTAPDGREVLYHFNTAQRLVDGRWVAYERRAETAIRLLLDKLKELRSRFDVYPKSRGMDRETWRESVRPYVQEAVRALLDC